MVDFSGLENRVRRENLRYSTEIFRPGQLQVSGCSLDKYFLEQASASFPLQSWGPELRHLVEVGEIELQCDVTIDTPTLNDSLSPEPAGRQVIIMDNHPYHSSFKP